VALVIPDDLRAALIVAAEAAGIRWDDLAQLIQGVDVRCHVSHEDSGKMLAFLTRRTSIQTLTGRVGSQPEGREFARRFAAEHLWEEVGSAQGGAKAKFLDDAALAEELVEWTVRWTSSPG
jgi:hypothetical protein